MDNNKYSDKELQKMAFDYAHESFTPWGSPRFMDVTIAVQIYELLKKARDGKEPQSGHQPS